MKFNIKMVNNDHSKLTAIYMVAIWIHIQIL